MQDLFSLLPLLVVGFGGIVLMLLAALDVIDSAKSAVICMGCFAAAFILQLLFGCGPEVTIFQGLFNGMLVSSNFTMAAGLVICCCGFFTAMSGHSYFSVNRFCTVEFYSVLLFAACGMILLTMAKELMTAFIAIEIMSLAVYILVGYDKTNVTATEAILKYLMLGAFAGAFFTMGTALVFGGAGSTKFAVIGQVVESANGMSGALIGGGIFILIALFFKAAAFPFHAWAVDVYDGASMPVTGFMATAVKTAVFVLFANFLAINAQFHSGWITVLFWISILSMFAGNLVAIGQDNIKRMLAASGIVHSGYLIIALVAINTESFSGSIIAYYLAAYAVGTVGMFAALSYLSGEGEKRIKFDDFKGMAKNRPFSAAAICIFLLSMAGIPPTAGFMGKFYVITAAINEGHMILAVLAVVSSAISMWYYLRLIINMYFHEADQQDVTVAGQSSLAQVSTFVLAIAVIVVGFYPIVA